MSKIQQIITRIAANTEQPRPTLEQYQLRQFVDLLRALDVLADEIRGQGAMSAVWQKCPICGGVGQVFGGYYGGASTASTTIKFEVCRQCRGTGLLRAPSGGQIWQQDNE